MNARILRKATSRGLCYRTWFHKGHRIVFSAPSRNAFGWFKLNWSVEGGHRGVDIARHRSLAKATARDIIDGKNRTSSLTPI